ncbi:MAG: sulfatase-like hydrolase/transferase, partial [Pseudomonadota bacterium]
MANTIVIMTDELRRDCLGCYGNTVVQTPHIDALAARGARFGCAYTPSPICVPARASIATGRHVHETRCWSNAQPYAGEPASWHHALRDAGQQVHSFGKLHFRSGADDNGFTHEHHPLHVVGGQGWVHGLLRDEDSLFDASGFAGHIGPGEDPYSDYDTRVCDAAVQWIAEQGAAAGAAPWCLYISFLRPHYPLTCPPAFYDLYDPAEVRLPRPARPEGPEQHPVLQWLRHTCDYDAPFDDASRRVAVASYFGLCSFVDHLVGRITGAVSAAGL